MLNVRTPLLAAALVAASASSTFAEGTGSQGYFQIYNDTEGNVVVGFYTNAGDGWSDNWLNGAQIMPGQNAEARFHANEGPCDQVFAVGWLGDNGSEVMDDPVSINICDASNVYLNDNEMYYD